MFYRVVIQGRTLGGADVESVKRDFLRVTGLPQGFADNLFSGVPRVIKRKVRESDAERIVATLRAIGAAATVEREMVSAEDETAEGFRIEATPLNVGPPSIIPGMEPIAEAAPPPRHARLLRAAREKLPHLVGAVLVIGGAVLAAPYADDLASKLRPAHPPAPVGAKPASANDPVAPGASVPLNATLLHGPWRCVDQANGTTTYWTYDADGQLQSHGNAFKEDVAQRMGDTLTWKVEGRRLVHAASQRAGDGYAVTELTLMKLRYGNERGLDIQCRRP